MPTRHLLAILRGDLQLCTSLFSGFFFESKYFNFPCSYPYRLGKPPVWVRGICSQISALFHSFFSCSFISASPSIYFLAFPSFQGLQKLCPINQGVRPHYPYDKNKSKQLSLHIVLHCLSPCRTRDFTPPEQSKTSKELHHYEALLRLICVYDKKPQPNQINGLNSHWFSTCLQSYTFKV